MNIESWQCDLRNIDKSQIGLVGDIKADGTIVMGDAILMVMKGESQKGERKTEKQE